MIRKKAVFLFGAGAVMDWGGPLTLCSENERVYIPDHGSTEITNRVCCLTHLLIDTGFKDKNGTRITQKIFDSLKAKNQDAVVNFETILNVIEELYFYWASRYGKASDNLYSILDIDDQIKDFSCFEPIYKAGTDEIQSISIPEYSKKYEVKEMHPKQVYYELLLNDLLTGIKGQVSKYAYHTQSHSVLNNPHNEVINKSFTQWVNGLIAEKYTLRMYTLNYDRSFKVLLQEQGIDVFEGFDLDEVSVPHGEKVKANLPKIITDIDSNIHYNLHGSAFWDIEEYNGTRMPGYHYLLAPFGKIKNYGISIEIEKGRKLLLTNIISGYQKVQRTAISPFRQMQSAFDRDCFKAHRLYLIGYSLGDEHINDIIRNAKKYNKHLEVIIITPSFDEKEFSKNFIIHWGNPLKAWKKNNGNEVLAPHFGVRVILKKFGRFLKDVTV